MAMNWFNNVVEKILANNQGKPNNLNGYELVTYELTETRIYEVKFLPPQLDELSGFNAAA